MSRGDDRERAVRDLLQAEDWWVCRAAGSLGDADLVALKPGRKLLIEVKSSSRERGPFADFGPKDRADLLFAAEMAGGEAVLVWWPPAPGRRTEPQWIWPADWPGHRLEAA